MRKKRVMTKKKVMTEGDKRIELKRRIEAKTGMTVDQFFEDLAISFGDALSDWHGYLPLLRRIDEYVTWFYDRESKDEHGKLLPDENGEVWPNNWNFNDLIAHAPKEALELWARTNDAKLTQRSN